MLSEAKFSQKLRQELRLQLPEAVIFKINDSFTAGIPDMAIVYEGRTLWVECKLVGNKPEDSKLQLETMRRLKNAVYVIWDPKGKEGQVFWVNYVGLNLPPRYFPFASLVSTLISGFIEDR